MAKVIAISCYGRDRDFEPFFLEHDIAVIGSTGWTEDWRTLADRSGVLSSDAKSLNALAGADVGDIALMMHGYEVSAVGVVAEPYEYRDKIGRMSGGWECYHTIRVRWVKLDRPGPRYAFRARCRVVRKEAIARWATDRVAGLEPVMDRPLNPLPPEVRPWDLSVLSEHEIFAKVVARSRALRDAVERREWRNPPSEHEIVALLVVPLLLDMEWEPTQLALEWRQVDVVAFAGDDRTDDTARLVVEAKRLDRGLASAIGQARGYACKHDFPGPIITTNGFDWELYESPAEDVLPWVAHLPDLDTRAEPFFVEMLRRCRPA